MEELTVFIAFFSLFGGNCADLFEHLEKRADYLACVEECQKSETCRQATFLQATSSCFKSVDGSWSEWSVWGQCPVECGQTGSRVRSRSCTNPPRQYGGLNCEGSGSETDVCNKPYGASPDCQPTWSPWGEWSGCSAPCGGDRGVKMRSRLCLGEEYGTSCSGGSSSSYQDCYRYWGQDGCQDSHYSVRVLSEGGAEDSMDWGSPLAYLTNRMFYVMTQPLTSSTREPGLNVVVLSRETGTVRHSLVGIQVFKAENMSGSADTVVMWSSTIPEDSVILASVYLDAGDCGSPCMDVFKNFGARKSSLGYRDSYALVGYKGWGCGWSSEPSWVKEKHKKYPGESQTGGKDFMTEYVDITEDVQSVCNL